jgi:Glycosyl transferase family 2
VNAPRPEPPAEIVALAAERSAARAAQDWPRADALRAEIEAAGWKVIDRGTRVRLEPATPPTVEEEGVVRYGAAGAVPSVLEEPPTARFTVVLLAEEWPTDLARVLGGLRAHAPAGTQAVIVANDPSPAQVERLAPGALDLAPIAGAVPEVVWTSQRLGAAAARNVGLRRARGEVVVLADTSTEPAGDALSPLVDAFADPAVAVAGGFGLVSGDLRRFAEGTGPTVDAVEMDWLAFRRADFRALGPLDERFTIDRHLGTWWSLVLRAGPDDGAPPREARRLDLPLVRHAHRGWTALSDADRDRLARRNFYRVLDRFRARRDLLSGLPVGARPAGPDEPTA